MNSPHRRKKRRRDAAIARKGMLDRIAKHPVMAIIGIIVTIAGVVLAATGPLADEGHTTPDSLSVKTISNDGVTQFILPLDAPLDEFPFEPTSGCTESMLEWLRAHGTERPPFYRLSVRNTASAGPMLSIDNVRAVETKDSKVEEPVIYFDCPSAGQGDTAELNLHLDRAGPAEAIDDSGKPSPFSFNLEPGEQGALELRLIGNDRTYSGKIVADVSVGTETRKIELPLNRNTGTFSHAGLHLSAGLEVAVGNYDQELFSCEYLDPEGESIDIVPCAAAEVRDRYRQLWSDDQRACGRMRRVDSTGAALPEAVVKEVSIVHAAACRGDYNALQESMDVQFSGESPTVAIEQLRMKGPSALVSLAETLEESPNATQGGMVYCHSNGMVAVFSRGTEAYPTRWTELLEGERGLTHC